MWDDLFLTNNFDAQPRLRTFENLKTKLKLGLIT